MKVIRRGPEGLPREVELTEAEALVKEIHSNLMDRGLDQGTALIHMTAADLPPDLRQPTPFLDAALADDEFRLWVIS